MKCSVCHDILSICNKLTESYSVLQQCKYVKLYIVQASSVKCHDSVNNWQSFFFPRWNQPPPTNKKRPKRKAGCLEVDSQVKEQDSSSTKRRKNVLKSRKENKSAPAKASNPGQDKKLFECHLCTFTSNRRHNLTTHIKTHDPNRVK
jgi:hypothetical protein